MSILFTYWFEILLAFFLIAWLVLRQSGWWQKRMTGHYETEEFFRERFIEVWQGAEKAMMACEFSILNQDEMNGIIQAEAKWTMKSFGERIIVTIKEKEEGVSVHFKSNCKLETQIFDWGKNKKNARCFFQALSNKLDG
jgi:hypothetical protein